MLSEDELREAILLVFANKQVGLLQNTPWHILSLTAEVAVRCTLSNNCQNGRKLNQTKIIIQLIKQTNLQLSKWQAKRERSFSAVQCSVKSLFDPMFRANLRRG